MITLITIHIRTYVLCTYNVYIILLVKAKMQLQWKKKYVDWPRTIINSKVMMSQIQHKQVQSRPRKNKSKYSSKQNANVNKSVK